MWLVLTVPRLSNTDREIMVARSSYPLCVKRCRYQEFVAIVRQIARWSVLYRSEARHGSVSCYPHLLGLGKVRCLALLRRAYPSSPL